MYTVPELTEIAMWSLIVGFFMPLLIAVVQQSVNPAIRALTAVASSAVAGLGVVYFTQPDEFHTRPVVTSILLVTVVAISMYKHFWLEVAPRAMRKVDEKTRVSGH